MGLLATGVTMPLPVAMPVCALSLRQHRRGGAARANSESGCGGALRGPGSECKCSGPAVRQDSLAFPVNPREYPMPFGVSHSLSLEHCLEYLSLLVAKRLGGAAPLPASTASFRYSRVGP